jgi:hypothetical protein
MTAQEDAMSSMTLDIPDKDAQIWNYADLIGWFVASSRMYL